MTYFPAFTLLFVQKHSCLHKIKRKLHGSLKIEILFSRGKILFSPLENKIYILAPACNILNKLYLWCNK